MKDYKLLFLRHQNATTIEIEDGVEVSLDSGLMLLRLNGTAKMVWELAIKPVSLDEVVKNVNNVYGRSLSLAREEVLQFLDQATHHGVILQFILGSDAP